MLKNLILLVFFAQSVLGQTPYTVQLDTLTLFDNTRNRPVPVALYSPKVTKGIKKQKLVIFSHGYGKNKGGDYVAYSYLTEKLASEGYFVASIQHELPSDSLMPLVGVPQVVRRPFWERGVENIYFVIKQLQISHRQLDFNNIVLMGHSNGGDMTALFPQKYPRVVTKIITLDNRRMALPKSQQVKVYSLRSSDQPADAGVLPTEADQKKYKMTIVKLLNTIHNHMDDNASDAQRAEINGYVLQFLQD